MSWKNKQNFSEKVNCFENFKNSKETFENYKLSHMISPIKTKKFFSGNVDLKGESSACKLTNES